MYVSVATRSLLTVGPVSGVCLRVHPTRGPSRVSTSEVRTQTPRGWTSHPDPLSCGTPCLVPQDLPTLITIPKL